MATNSKPERRASLSSPKKRLTLADAIRLAVEPVLRRLSDDHNKTAWSFAYRDADTSVSFCVGYSDLASRTPCSAADLYAWGSATKTHTALLIVQLAEKGLFKLDDTLISLANDYLRAISSGRSDLILLFGPEVKDVTVRQLLQMTAGITEYDTARRERTRILTGRTTSHPCGFSTSQTTHSVASQGHAPSTAVPITSCWGSWQRASSTLRTGTPSTSARGPSAFQLIFPRCSREEV